MWQLWMRPDTFKVTEGPQGHFSGNLRIYGKRTLKHVNQRLGAIIYAFQSGENISDAPHLE